MSSKQNKQKQNRNFKNNRKDYDRPTRGHQSFNSSYNGVIKFVKGRKLMPELKGTAAEINEQEREWMRNYMNEYFQITGQEYDTGNSLDALWFNANRIQNDFTQFVKYVNGK